MLRKFFSLSDIPLDVLPDLEEIDFIPDPEYTPSGDIVIWFDMKRIDSLLAKDDPFYIDPNSKYNPDKYNGFASFLKKNLPVKMPHLHYDVNLNKFGLLNGRNRFAYLRDHGLTRIPMTMNNLTAQMLNKNYNLN